MPNEYGVIFKIGTDGSGFTNLHRFAGGNGDGAYPFGSLTVSGTTLYGMTYQGGASNQGVVFKINSDGSGYTNLHRFAGGAGDGAYPEGSLALSNNTLYGMTSNGGASGCGTVFKINTDGSGYSILHSFNGSTTDGYLPMDSLTLNGTTLYGMTYGAGAFNRGVLFLIKVDGSGYTNLHSFTGSDGKWPLGSLALGGTALYGAADNVFAYVLGTGSGDSVGDGIPDWWRAQYFPHVDPSGKTTNYLSCATCDADGTGQNNLFKYLAGLNPTNSASMFRILSIAPNGSDLNVTWQTAGGKTNSLQATGSMGIGYTNVSPNLIIQGTGDTTMNWLDPGAYTNQPSRFYRIQLVP